MIKENSLKKSEQTIQLPPNPPIDLKSALQNFYTSKTDLLISHTNTKASERLLFLKKFFEEINRTIDELEGSTALDWPQLALNEIVLIFSQCSKLQFLIRFVLETIEGKNSREILKKKYSSLDLEDFVQNLTPDLICWRYLYQFESGLSKHVLIPLDKLKINDIKNFVVTKEKIGHLRLLVKNSLKSPADCELITEWLLLPSSQTEKMISSQQKKMIQFG